ncbi:MAG: C-terminal helicase domain-containing protein, partial [Promethearchaeota archaeon]
QKVCEDASVSFIRIEGKIPDNKRQPLVDKISNSETPERVAILSIKACSEGLTFSPGASAVAFTELYWTPDQMVQCEDRVHRIGQMNPVEIYYFVGNKTADDMVLRALKRKFKDNSDVIDKGKTAKDFDMVEESSNTPKLPSRKKTKIDPNTNTNTNPITNYFKS